MKPLHPLVVEFLEEFKAQQTSDRVRKRRRRTSRLMMKDLTCAAGISAMSIINWRMGHEPKISNLDKAFRVLGYKLWPVPLEDGE